MKDVIFKDVVFAASVVFVVFAIFAIIWIGKSYSEAEAYNRLTGSEVTTWDALWLDLRVIGEIQTETPDG